MTYIMLGCHTSDEGSYGGDITPEDAWKMLRNDHTATIIDVRTEQEWKVDGAIDLSQTENETKYISWRLLPDMSINTNFLNIAQKEITSMDTPILLLCKRGIRSVDAAKALTSIGFKNCYNILHGFGEDSDLEPSSNSKDSWKAKFLPWRQL